MSVKPSASLRCQCRRGSIYPAVLAYASLVTIIGLSALLALRSQRRANEGEIDFSQARLHARSAIELGMWVVENDAAWRATLPNGVWVKDRSIGTGTYTLEGIDPNDNDLANSALQPVVLTGTGVHGSARHKTEVRLEPEIRSLGCLGVALHAGANLNFDTATVQSDRPISANGRVDSINSSIAADVEAVTTINGTGYTGTTTTGINPRSMPTSAAFDFYLDRGTPIAVYDIPVNAGRARMASVLLSPASNPYGAETNPTGIYVIDCQGLDMEIRLCRIVGTLVLLNPGPGSIVKQSVNWEPAVKNYPALLVRGALAISLDAADLSEAATGVNFNPPGTPDHDDTDADLDDTYHSKIKGIVYVADDLFTSGSSEFDGMVVVGGTLNATGELDLEYKSRYFDNPPPGFYEVPGMRVVAGSWKQMVD